MDHNSLTCAVYSMYSCGWGACSMPVDRFSERLAKVRHRFMGREAAFNGSRPFQSSSAKRPEVTEVVGEAYRRLHGIVGVGPTVGFTATGRAARRCRERPAGAAPRRPRARPADEITGASRRALTRAARDRGRGRTANNLYSAGGEHDRFDRDRDVLGLPAGLSLSAPAAQAAEAQTRSAAASPPSSAPLRSGCRASRHRSIHAAACVRPG